MCTPPIVAKQRLGKHVPAATNTRNNRRIIGCVCLWVCLCIPLLLLGNNSVKSFRRQKRIFRGVVFYAARVVWKENRRSVLPRTSCLWSLSLPSEMSGITLTIAELHYAFRFTHLHKMVGTRYTIDTDLMMQSADWADYNYSQNTVIGIHPAPHHSGPYFHVSQACYLLHAGFLLGLLCGSEDGGDMLLRNIGWPSTDYTDLYLIKSIDLIYVLINFNCIIDLKFPTYANPSHQFHIHLRAINF
jgi:hypothetical protein